MPLFGERKPQPGGASRYEAPPLDHTGGGPTKPSRPRRTRPKQTRPQRTRVSPAPVSSEPRPPDRLTPEEVRNVAFGKPKIGRRGYDEDQVDAFLDRVVAELQHRGAGADG